jgi:excisionase family DNA binding protein
MVVDNQKDPKSEKELIRVSVSEAARLFGVNTQTIRRAIQAQEVTYVVVSGRYKLNFESLVKWSQKHTTVRNKLAKRGIGQFVDRWKIKNPLYSPNPKSLKNAPPQVKPEIKPITPETTPDINPQTTPQP